MTRLAAGGRTCPAPVDDQCHPGRGAGNNGPVSTAKASSFLNTAGKVGRVTISERMVVLLGFHRHFGETGGHDVR
jgi:hypothetical protein